MNRQSQHTKSVKMSVMTDGSFLYTCQAYAVAEHWAKHLFVYVCVSRLTLRKDRLTPRP
jgi:hypothetical protein